MSELGYLDKQQLEKLFGMEGGYVLDFTDRQFLEFFQTDFDIDIDNETYSAKGTSKADRMREFWCIEDNLIVSRVILGIIKLYKSGFTYSHGYIEVDPKNRTVC